MDTHADRIRRHQRVVLAIAAAVLLMASCAGSARGASIEISPGGDITAATTAGELTFTSTLLNITCTNVSLTGRLPGLRAPLIVPLTYIGQFTGGATGFCGTASISFEFPDPASSWEIYHTFPLPAAEILTVSILAMQIRVRFNALVTCIFTGNASGRVDNAALGSNDIINMAGTFVRAPGSPVACPANAGLTGAMTNPGLTPAQSRTLYP